MANPKRKRNGESAEEEQHSDAEESNTSGPVEVNEAEQTFSVQVLKNNTKPKSKRRKTANWTEVLYEEDFPGGVKVPYIINPGSEWQSMRKYKNFVVQDKNFGTGDHVFVKPAKDVEGVEDMGWVGKVLEIRARDATAVFVRIFWLYWQTELPMGPQPYHGEQELIMSNFMQIIDAQTVDGMVGITRIDESERNAPPAVGYYYRQTLDVTTNKLSTLRKDCKCNRYHNPDTLLLQCSECHKWQHEPCVVAEVLRQKWRQLENPNGVNGADGDEASKLLLTPASTSDTIALSPQSKNSAKKKGRKGKGVKAAGKEPVGKPSAQDFSSEPWHEVLEGLLERDEKTLADPKEGVEKEPENITGKVVVTDSRDKSGNRELVDAKCLFCQALLKDKEPPPPAPTKPLENGNSVDGLLNSIVHSIVGGGDDNTEKKEEVLENNT